MVKEQNQKKNLLPNSNNTLLSIKELLDQVIKEVDDIPSEVRNILVQARDTTWLAFTEAEEKKHKAI
jgi:hypothetical protein